MKNLTFGYQEASKQGILPIQGQSGEAINPKVAYSIKPSHKIAYTCKQCGKVWLNYPSDKSKYCSMECKYTGQKVAMKGWICSLETKAKISLSNKGKVAWSKGKKLPQFSGKNSYMFGKHLSEEHKRKISLAQKGKPESLKTRVAMSIIRKGKLPKNMSLLHSPEAIEKSRLAHIGRKQSKETIEKRVSKFRGSKCWNWKGGVTPLYEAIRKLPESKLWKITVFIRDNYTCQDCFVRGGKLHAHHEKAFTLIFKEFLTEYSQFSPIEDKETLLKLAITYAPFWEIDNGKTLCKKCHKKYTTRPEFSKTVNLGVCQG